MQVTTTNLDGVLLVEPVVHRDDRGFFLEVYRDSLFRDRGMKVSFVQDNHSRSVRGVVRGLHYQLRHPQAKLCRVVAGAVLDVAVDIRQGSPTYGQVMVVELSADNHRQVYIPPGIAHGFAVVSDYADFLYKCDSEYDPADEYGIRWDDPTLCIDWSVESALLSERDRQLPLLKDVPIDKLPEWSK